MKINLRKILTYLTGQKEIHCIENIGDLIDNLGLSRESSNIVLLVGSAVSGCNYPNLPMVENVLEGVFKCVIKKLNASKLYNEKIAAGYAKTLIRKDKSDTDFTGKDYGKYYQITRTTKFEEFLGIIEQVLGRGKLDELLTGLFLCKNSEYGKNQSAITWLMENGICSFCLTTNFDNTIENSSKKVKVYTHLNFLSAENYLFNSKILLKLHGDVVDNSCVATHRSLFKHSNEGTYSFLQELLKHKKILVLGYSGYGDVDISPNLAQTEADFYWCEYNRNRQVPDYSIAKVLCDLKSDDSEKNLLHGLAKCYGWSYTDKVESEHRWNKHLREWCNSVDNKNLVDILIRVFLSRPGWQVVHLITLFPNTIISNNSRINKGRACLQKSAYGPAEKIFSDLIHDNSIDQNQRISSYLYLGFVQWRKGKFKESLKTLWWFYSLEPGNYDESVYMQIGDGLRMYLEVVRDMMRLRIFKKARENIYNKYNVADVIAKIENIRTYDFQDDILMKVVLFYISFLRDRRKNKKIVTEAMDIIQNSLSHNKIYLGVD